MQGRVAPIRLEASMLTTLTAHEMMTGRQTLARQRNGMPLWFLFGLGVMALAMLVLYVLGVDPATSQFM
jgi:hypothetical protein